MATADDYVVDEFARRLVVTRNLWRHVPGIESVVRRLAPLAVRLSKMMMEKAATISLEASLADAQMAVMIANPSDDVREGLKAFREKRAPKFEGR